MFGTFALRRTLRSTASLPRKYSTNPIQSVRTLPQFSLKEKVCVVTGAARGLGFEFCRAFIESGCNRLAIFDLDQKDSDSSRDTLVASYESTDRLKDENLDVMSISCDVTKEEAVRAAFQKVVDRFGRVDSVVASAGLVHNFSAMEYPTEKMKFLYDVNVHGSFFTAREAARQAMEIGNKLSVVLVASMSAHIINIPQPQTPYNASKAAVLHMTSSLAMEWAKKGIRVNSISPGYILTKLTRDILAKDANGAELKRTWESLTPIGHLGQPEDLKGAIVFLASDASSFMTGADLRVDGGYCCI